MDGLNQPGIKVVISEHGWKKKKKDNQDHILTFI